MHAYSHAALHVDHGSKRIDSESLGIELIPKVGMDPIKRNRLLTQSLFQFNKAYLCLYVSEVSSYEGCTHIHETKLIENESVLRSSEFLCFRLRNTIRDECSQKVIRNLIRFRIYRFNEPFKTRSRVYFTVELAYFERCRTE